MILDLAFATSLLNAAVKDKNITNNISIESVPTQITPTVQESIYETNAEINISSDDTDSRLVKTFIQFLMNN